MSKKICVLFDVDGTLTIPRNVVKPEMTAYLKELRSKVTIGLVGGSDLVKQKEQLGDDVLDQFDWTFSENGLDAYKMGVNFHKASMTKFLGEEKLQKFINFSMKYMSELTIPCKRGTFVEYRTGMLNISPVGRQCSQSERDDYEKFDLANNVRKDFVAALQKEFAGWGLRFSIGGQISFDVFPEGWDKTYALQHIASENFDEIHFFGDKTMEGGNDFEIYNDPRTIGHSVKTWEDTMRICKELFP